MLNRIILFCLLTLPCSTAFAFQPPPLEYTAWQSLPYAIEPVWNQARNAYKAVGDGDADTSAGERITFFSFVERHPLITLPIVGQVNQTPASEIHILSRLDENDVDRRREINIIKHPQAGLDATVTNLQEGTDIETVTRDIELFNSVEKEDNRVIWWYSEFPNTQYEKNIKRKLYFSDPPPPIDFPSYSGWRYDPTPYKTIDSSIEILKDALPLISCECSREHKPNSSEYTYTDKLNLVTVTGKDTVGSTRTGKLEIHLDVPIRVGSIAPNAWTIEATYNEGRVTQVTLDGVSITLPDEFENLDQFYAQAAVQQIQQILRNIRLARRLAYADNRWQDFDNPEFGPTLGKSDRMPTSVEGLLVYGADAAGGGDGPPND